MAIKKITGISGNSFQIGEKDTSKVNLVNVSGVLEHQDTNGDPLVIRTADAVADTDAASLRNVKDGLTRIDFDFNGASAPSAGTNTNKYGFCHTTGGAQTQGRVYLDNGTTLDYRSNVVALITTSAVSGAVSLNANGIYALESSTWTLKGDGNSGGGGGTSSIKVAFAFNNATPTSTTSIVDGDDIYMIRVVVTTAFDGTAPTLAVATDGSSPKNLVLTTDFDITVVEQYGIDDIYILSTNEGGHVDITVVPDGSTTGEGFVEVFYTTPNA